MRVVIADSSVFIHLANIGKMVLLRELYQEVLIPPAVWEEVVVAGKGRPGETGLRLAIDEKWISIASPAPDISLPANAPPLHPGETEAIHLAMSNPGSLLVMDEAAGRTLSKQLGLQVIGIVGLLVLAKQRGLIPNLANELQRLRVVGGFRLSSELTQHALRIVGET